MRDVHPPPRVARHSGSVRREVPVLILLAGLTLTLCVTAAPFRSRTNLMALGESAAVTGLLAIGEAIVVLGGGLDLSVASVFALASCAAAVLLSHGTAPVVAMLACIAAGLAGGAFNGWLVGVRRLPAILATLATLLLFRHGVSIVTGSRNYGPFPTVVGLISSGWTPLVVLLLAAGLWQTWQQRATIGRRLVALGGGEETAALMGLSVSRLRVLMFTCAGGMAALSGLIAMSYNNNTQSSVGTGYELDAIAACVVGGVRLTGGVGSVAGAALGAVLVAILRNGLVLSGRPAEQYGLFTGAIILGAALLEGAGAAVRRRRAGHAT